MKRGALIIVLALTAAVPGAAQAHYGDLWFDTAARTAENIERKFPRVDAARCYAIPIHLRRQYNAHSQIRGSTRQWDHFLCLLAPRRASVCATIAHMTGREWHQFVLTSFPKDGCSPYVLR